MNKETLILRYPKLYHMAEGGSWPSIEKHGLLSTRAVLDRLNIEGEARTPLESNHRKENIKLTGKQGKFVLRDQKPMSEARLLTALPPEIPPSDWYRFINSRVFFWTREERLHGLLGAREYRGVHHDVLIVDTRSLVGAHESDILLCHMNSGNTFPFAHPRDFSIFRDIASFPAKPSGKPVKEVAELTVDYSVPDISAHVLAVVEMKGNTVIRDIYRR